MNSPTDVNGAQAYTQPTQGGAQNDLAALLAKADPELLKQMMEAGIIDEKQALLAEQNAQAKALRGTGMPQGQMLGNVYVAPSAFQNVAAALQQFQGMRDQNRLQSEQSDLVDQKLRDRMAGLKVMGGTPFGYGSRGY